MRHCEYCNIDVDNSFNLCPYCGRELTASTTKSSDTSRNSDSYRPPQQHMPSPDAIPFQTFANGKCQFNGQVIECITQQFYQSKLTKIIRAIFYGEPYQLSHTTFVTVFRIEEYTQHGFSEQSRDLVIYGQLQNILSAGDDVTVTAHYKGQQIVADYIINHSSEIQFSPQKGSIPASLIRIPFAILVILLLSLLVALFSTPTHIIFGTLMKFLWPIILICIFVIWLKNKFKRR